MSHEFQGTASESLMGLNEEATYGDGGTLTEWIPFRSFNWDLITNERVRAGALGQVQPMWSGRGEPRSSFSFTVPLWAEGLEPIYKYAWGKHQSTNLQDTTQGVYEHLYKIETRYYPEYSGSGADPSAASLNIGVYHGSLKNVAGRYTALRGCVITRSTIRVQRNDAFMQCDGFFHDACTTLTAPAPTVSTKRLFNPTRTNWSLTDATEGTPDANVHWDPVSIEFTVERGMDHAYAMGHSALQSFRRPEAPHRTGEIAIRMSVDLVSEDNDFSATTGGNTFETIHNEGLPIHQYFQLFGKQINDATDGAGDPKPYSLQVQTDYNYLTRYNSAPIDGYGRIMHHLEMEADTPPSGFTLANLLYGEVLNEVSSFGVR